MSNDLTKFDVRRLTAVGLLLFAGSVLFAFASLAATWVFYADLFAPEIQPDGSYMMQPMIPFLAFLLGGLGCFFSAKILLGLLGITAVRPKESDYTINPALRRKFSHPKRDESDD